MTAGQLKGALLEHIVRTLMHSCGFASVKPDGLYIYAQAGNGLFFINGKGAAHDADVLMEPPIQVPFSHPSRILFECKAYDKKVGLTVIRNALGLRYDINEFEIVTDDTIRQRKNNRRASYAIADRKRYHYQVGVASVEPFSAAAFEFAANNKIPLLSLSWVLPDHVCSLFSRIDKRYFDSLGSQANEIYSYLKRKKTLSGIDYPDAPLWLDTDEIIGEVLRNLDLVLAKSYIALNEAGDLLFLFAVGENPEGIFNADLGGLRARIHYSGNEPDLWLLELSDDNVVRGGFRFFVPHRIMNLWQRYSFDQEYAIDLKQNFFSRIFIFPHHQQRRSIPFVSATIDQPWLEGLRG